MTSLSLRRRLPGKGRYSRKHGSRQQEFAFVNLNLTAGASSVLPPRHHLPPTRDRPPICPPNPSSSPPRPVMRPSHEAALRTSRDPHTKLRSSSFVSSSIARHSPLRLSLRSATVSKGPLHIDSLQRNVRTASHRLSLPCLLRVPPRLSIRACTPTCPRPRPTFSPSRTAFPTAALFAPLSKTLHHPAAVDCRLAIHRRSD